MSVSVTDASFAQETVIIEADGTEKQHGTHKSFMNLFVDLGIVSNGSVVGMPCLVRSLADKRVCVSVSGDPAGQLCRAGCLIHMALMSARMAPI